jgi:hypothetical protein
MTEKTNKWEFSQDKSKRWSWRKLLDETIVEVSSDNFDSFRGCLESASQRGYILPLVKPKRFR